MPSFLQTRVKPSPKVYTTPSLATGWTERPYLRPVHCNWQLGAFGTAEFRWEYGRIKQPGDVTFSDVSPLDIRDHFIMIQWVTEYNASAIAQIDDDGLETLDGIPIGWLENKKYWVGVVTGIEDGQLAGQPPSGAQRIYATSSEILLQRIQVKESWTLDRRNDIPGKNPALVTPTRIPRGIAFNASSSDIHGTTYAVGNRDTASNLFALYMDPQSSRPWTAAEIMQYLIDRVIYPSFEFGVFEIPEWAVDNFALNFIPLDVQTHGRNLYDIINSIINRRRGLIWWIEPYMTDTPLPLPRGFYIRVASILRETQQISDTQQILANPRQITLDLRNSPHISDISLTDDALNQYHQVVVEGAPPTATFSIKLDKTWDDWTADELDRYRAGVSAMDGYEALDLSDQMTRNDQARQSDQLRHVFVRHRLTVANMQGDGFGEENVIEDNNDNPGRSLDSLFYGLFPDFTVPHADTPGWEKTPTPHDPAQVEQWEPLLRLENQLRISPRVEYSEDDPEGSWENTTQEFMRPMVFWYDFQNNRYYNLDRIGAFAALDETKGDGGVDYSVGLRMHDHQCGFDLVPSDGHSHRFQNEYVFDGTSGNAVSHLEQWTAEPKDITLTLCANAGIPLRIVYPATPGPFRFDQQAQHMINLGERARLDWIVGGTAYDVAEDQSELKISKHHVLRDDRPTMYYLARAAWNWYSTPRKALQFTAKQILENSYTIGTLIRNVIVRDDGTSGFTIVTLGGTIVTTLGGVDLAWGVEEPVNTVVSSIAIDWVSGTTRVETAFAELDFEGLV